MKVFISWSGDRSRKVAEALYKWLQDLVFPLDVYASFKEDPAGRWRTILEEKLLESEFAILCMTPGNVISPWILYEAGALSNKGAERPGVCPYLYEVGVDELPEQLKQFGACTADESGTKQLFKAIVNRLRETEDFSPTKERLNDRFNATWPGLKESLDAIHVQDVSARISARIAEAQPRLWNALEGFKSKRFFRQNPFYRSLLAKYLDDCRKSLTVSDAYFDLPYILYPSYLIALLEELKPTVKAIAIVDVYEHFWRQGEGEIIRKQTPEDSTRVFVFDKIELLRSNQDLLLRHAEKYNVYVLSLASLAAERPDKCYDFSLIGSTEMTLLAKYDSAGGGGMAMKQIRFSAMSPDISPEISRHEKAFVDIVSVAFKLEKDGSWHMPARLQVDGAAEHNPDIHALSEAVFRPDIITLQRREVEMSNYIDVIEYDKYEEQHPYYEEMMARMIRTINSHRVPDRPIRILEFGAGTGIFSRRLLRLPLVHVTALEIDWACFHILRKNLEQLNAQIHSVGSSYLLLNNDSRHTNPEGSFDFIVSSFADHHIHPLDKKPYFRNVGRNLAENATFIVGDEFLPDYDVADEPDRRRALNLYHDHIVEKAREAGQLELVKLEEQARESGLKGKGDYKLSIAHYERFVKDAGLKVIRIEKIGPLDLALDQVGGIYVYEIGRNH